MLSTAPRTWKGTPMHLTVTVSLKVMFCGQAVLLPGPSQMYLAAGTPGIVLLYLKAANVAFFSGVGVLTMDAVEEKA